MNVLLRWSLAVLAMPTVGDCSVLPTLMAALGSGFGGATVTVEVPEPGGSSGATTIHGGT
jgi:hypothetical protein